MKKGDRIEVTVTELIAQGTGYVSGLEEDTVYLKLKCDSQFEGIREGFDAEYELPIRDYFTQQERNSLTRGLRFDWKSLKMRFPDGRPSTFFHLTLKDGKPLTEEEINKKEKDERMLDAFIGKNEN